jgi:hypothetical protein
MIGRPLLLVVVSTSVPRRPTRVRRARFARGVVEKVRAGVKRADRVRGRRAEGRNIVVVWVVCKVVEEEDGMERMVRR